MKGIVSFRGQIMIESLLIVNGQNAKGYNNIFLICIGNNLH
jgi:hypothetical protein